MLEFPGIVRSFTPFVSPADVRTLYLYRGGYTSIQSCRDVALVHLGFAHKVTEAILQ
jgi:hypothetical protein